LLVRAVQQTTSNKSEAAGQQLVDNPKN